MCEKFSLRTLGLLFLILIKDHQDVDATVTADLLNSPKNITGIDKLEKVVA